MDLHDHKGGDADLRSIRTMPMYRSAMAEALLPGDDVRTRLLRSDFSEMLLQHLERGGEVTLTAIGASLAEFTPARVSTTDHPTWKDRVAEQWTQVERPHIFAAMEAFFLDGGLEQRLADQQNLFAALQAAGVEFGDTNVERLIYLVTFAGDWRNTFVQLAVTGRDQGIKLRGTTIDRPAFFAALANAGFTRDQGLMIWGSVGDGGPHSVEADQPAGVSDIVKVWATVSIVSLPVMLYLAIRGLVSASSHAGAFDGPVEALTGPLQPWLYCAVLMVNWVAFKLLYKVTFESTSLGFSLELRRDRAKASAHPD